MPNAPSSSQCYYGLYGTQLGPHSFTGNRYTYRKSEAKKLGFRAGTGSFLLSLDGSSHLETQHRCLDHQLLQSFVLGAL